MSLPLFSKKQMVYLYTKHKQMFQWLLGVLTRDVSEEVGVDHSTCVLVIVGDNVVLKGVIMALLWRRGMCAGNNGGAGRRVLVTSGEGSGVRGSRLMEAKQPPAPAPAVQKSAFSVKTQTTSKARATRYVNTRGNLIPSFEYSASQNRKRNRPSLSLEFLNLDQISGPWGEEIVVHFLTNWVKRTLSRL